MKRPDGPDFVLLLFCIVVTVTVWNLTLYYSERFDSLQSQIDTVNDKLQCKADAEGLQTLQSLTDGLDIKVKEWMF